MLLSTYILFLTLCVARPSWRDEIIASNCLQFLGLPILGAEFESLCSSLTTYHFSPSVLQDLLREMELLHQIACNL